MKTEQTIITEEDIPEEITTREKEKLFINLLLSTDEVLDILEEKRDSDYE